MIPTKKCTSIANYSTFGKVFRPLDFYYILLKWIKYMFSSSTYNTP